MKTTLTQKQESYGQNVLSLKSKFLGNVFVVFLFFAWVFPLQSQNLQVISGSNIPDQVYACGETSDFSFRIFGPMQANTQISVQLPVNCEVLGLAQPTAGVLMDLPAVNTPNFTLENALGSASDFMDIVYTVRTGCQNTPSNSTISHEIASYNLSQTVPFSSVAYPALEIGQVSPPSATLASGAFQIFNVTIVNNPVNIDAYSKNVVLKVTHSENVSVEYQGNATVLTNTSTALWLEFDADEISALGNGNEHFEINESLVVPIKATLLDCSDEGGETITYEVAYGGCLAANAQEYCFSSNSGTSGIQTLEGTPNLVTQIIEPGYPSFCTPGTTTMQVSNNGTGPLYDLVLNMGFHNGINTYLPQSRPYLYFNNVHIQGDNQPIEISNNYLLFGDPSPVLFTNFAPTTDPDGPGGISDLDGDGYYDDLAANESFNLVFDIVYDLQAREEMIDSNCETPNYMNQNHDRLRWSVGYNDFCGENTTYLVSDPQAQHYTPIELSSVTGNANLIGTNNGPNFNDGDLFDFDLNLGADQTNLYQNFPNLRYRIILEFPPGVVPNGNGIRYRLSNGSFLDDLILLSYDPQTRTAIYETQNVQNQSFRLNTRSVIPLKLVCDPSVTNGPNTIRYSLQIVPNEEGCDESPIFFCEDSNVFTINCPTESCIGVTIEEYSFERITLGFTDDTETVLVNPEQANSDNDINNDIRTDRVTNGDRVLLDATLRLNGTPEEYASAVIDLNYDQSNIFRDEHEGGMKSVQFTYMPAGTNNSIIYDVSSYYNYEYGQTCRHYIDIVEWANAENIQLQNGDSIRIEMVLQVPKGIEEVLTQNAYIPNLPTEVSQLLLSVPTQYNNETTIYNCNSEASLLESVGLFYRLITFTQSINLNGCNQDELNVGIFHNRLGTAYGDLDFFPNEFRSLLRLNNMTFYLENGVSYIEGSSKYAYERSQNNSPFNIIHLSHDLPDPIITFNALPGFTKYEYIVDDSWPLNDLFIKGLGSQRIIFNVIANCLNENEGGSFEFKFDPDIEFVTYRQTINEETLRVGDMHNEEILSISRPLNVNPTEFVFSSESPTYTANNALAEWPITLNNTTNTGAPANNMWVAIEIPNNNFTPTLWENDTQQELLSYGTGKYWAQVGSLETIKNLLIRANISTICDNEQFLVRVGQNCAGYPENPDVTYNSGDDNYTCANEQSTTFYLNVNDPSIQILSNIGQNGVSYDFCDAFPFNLNVKNVASGFAYDFFADIILPQGLDWLPNSAKIEYGNTLYDIPMAAVFYDPILNKIIIDFNQIDGLPFGNDNGLPGINDASPSEFQLKLELKMQCDFTPSSTIYAKVSAKSACGESIPTNSGINEVNTLPIFIEQISPDIAYSIDISSDICYIAHYDEDITFTVNITNQGDEITNEDLERIQFVMDESFSFQTGSTQSIQNGPNTDPTIELDSQNNIKVVYWPLPNGVGPGESVSYSFTITAPNTFPSDTNNYPFEISTLNVQAIICDNGETVCESLQSVTMEEDISLPMKLLELDDIYSCNGEIITLDAGSGFAQYLWNTGSTEQSISVSEAGTYSVKAWLEEDCFNTEEVILELGQSFVDDVQVDGRNAKILAIGEPPLQYSLDSIQWQDSNEFINLPFGQYAAFAKDSFGCISEPHYFYILEFANTITPNDDGVNDAWDIPGIVLFPGAQIQIFDRYGKIMVEHTVPDLFGNNPPSFQERLTLPPYIVWDGKYQGRPVPTSSYWYKIILPGIKEFTGYILVKNRNFIN